MMALMTQAAAECQRMYLAKLVATGQWHGPAPSAQVLEVAFAMAKGQAAFELAA
jgi:hypothetical protein